MALKVSQFLNSEILESEVLYKRVPYSETVLYICIYGAHRVQRYTVL